MRRASAARLAVEQLAEDVGVPGVPSRLLQQVGERPAKVDRGRRRVV
ncbi:MAG TPA: hypothetical protein VGZ03_10815 [Acidimicrobiales bacterium]|nr:hypothetical protein [Acidimicrobiales bacterium]